MRITLAETLLTKIMEWTPDEIDREALTLAANLTGPGIILGTAAYILASLEVESLA